MSSEKTSPVPVNNYFVDRINLTVNPGAASRDPRRAPAAQHGLINNQRRIYCQELWSDIARDVWYPRGGIFRSREKG